MTGVLLAIAQPNRKLIYWRAGVRLAAALIAAISTGLWMAFAGGSPAFWLTGTGLLSMLTIALIIACAVPLRFLTRRFELYEDGFEVHDQQVRIEEIEHLFWRRQVVRLFGCIPTDSSYLELTCLLKTTRPKQKRGHTLRYSEQIYLHLYDCFEEAYEQSIPATYSLTLSPATPRKTDAAQPDVISQGMKAMEIRTAVPADLAQMMEIVEQAQLFLRESGVDQWQDGYPTRELLLRDIETEQAYLLVDGEQIAAFAVLIFGGEPDYDIIYDGAWHGSAEYLTVHRVAVNTARRQNGAASRLLAHAEQICRQKGVYMLRIDTHADNLAMQGMLTKNGFSRCGRVRLSGGEDRVAFDKLLKQ